MSEQQYNKLVRDKIPAVIRANGAVPQIRTLDDEEYRIELLKKAAEELAEFTADMSLEERADVEEVLKALDELQGFTPKQIEQARIEKATARGAFKKRIFLESAEEA